MKPDDTNNAYGSAATSTLPPAPASDAAAAASPAGPRGTGPSAPSLGVTTGTPAHTAHPKGTPPKETSEAYYLTRQAEDAKAAIGKVMADLGKDLGAAADPRGWTKEHPWAALATAAMAGFAGAALLTPTKEDAALKRLQAIEEALRPKFHTDGTSHAAHANTAPAKSGAAGGLLAQILKTLQPALVSVVSGLVSANAAKPSDEELQAAAEATGPPAPDANATN